jgi:hypothetical protein
VKHTVHVVAIDEVREPFYPTLVALNDNTEEVWFPGVHSDIGGGYKERTLADISLRFMAERADAFCLDFKLATMEALQINSSNAGDILENNKDGKFSESSRKIIVRESTSGTTAPKVHESAFKRIDSNAINYKPKNLDRDRSNYQIWTAKVANEQTPHQPVCTD